MNLNKLVANKKDTMIYTAIISAGFIYLIKSLYGGKSPKRQMNKGKKVILRRSKLFFKDLHSKKVEMKNKEELMKFEQGNSVYHKMRKFMDNISQKMAKDEEKGITAPPNRRDQIFYCLLSNFLVKKVD